MASIYLNGEGYCHNPEPVTMVLLSLGSLVLLRRKNS